jgi:hypothetical protein
MTPYANVKEVEGIWDQLQVLASDNFVWGDYCRRAFLTLHAFHTTGIEGNTLTLSETALVIHNKPLFAGFPDDAATPVTLTSLKEVRNTGHIMYAYNLAVGYYFEEAIEPESELESVQMYGVTGSIKTNLNQMSPSKGDDCVILYYDTRNNV